MQVDPIGSQLTE
ncbi:unnamed protein product, partial [Rotaria magnacalcarata]